MGNHNGGETLSAIRAVLGAAEMQASGSGSVFKSTISSRRFPALSTLTADDVEVMVMKPPSGSQAGKDSSTRSHQLFDPDLVKPSAATSLSAPGKPPAAAKARPAASGTAGVLTAKAPTPDRPPFVPCNPSQARYDITLNHTDSGYVGKNSPYDMSHQLQQAEREESQRLHVGGVFIPASAATAKKGVAVNYYLNSPDAETIEAERRYIKDRADRNLTEYHRRAQNLKQGSISDSAAFSDHAD